MQVVDTAESLDDAWQDGLAFYADLSTDTRSLIADGTGWEMVVWNPPDVVIEEILNVVRSPSE